MKKVAKTLLKILGVLLIVAGVILVAVYFTVLRYPNLKNDPKVGKWYRVETQEMKSSEGGKYHAFFKKGSENKVMVYFAGGGVSVNEQTARNDTYNTKLVWPDMLANLTMNMGGLAVPANENPFGNWTVIMFPYATGDFHCGAGEFKYTDKDGKEKILYHNGYINFTSAMELIMERAGIDNPEAVVVTGYSAGGWGASLLADDVFSYFPNAQSKTVLVDSSMALNDEWPSIARNVWQAPEHIAERAVSDNIMLDMLTALHQKWGDDVTILYDTSTRDGSLAQVQAYFKNKIIDEETGEMPVDEQDADAYQQTLKEFIPALKEQAGAYLFIWDGQSWYDDPRNMTAHTIIATPAVFVELNDTGCSIAEWLMSAVNGEIEDFGLELVGKKY